MHVAVAYDQVPRRKRNAQRLTWQYVDNVRRQATIRGQRDRAITTLRILNSSTMKGDQPAVIFASLP